MNPYSQRDKYGLHELALQQEHVVKSQPRMDDHVLMLHLAIPEKQRSFRCCCFQTRPEGVPNRRACYSPIPLSFAQFQSDGWCLAISKCLPCAYAGKPVTNLSKKVVLWLIKTEPLCQLEPSFHFCNSLIVLFILFEALFVIHCCIWQSQKSRDYFVVVAFRHLQKGSLIEGLVILQFLYLMHDFSQMADALWYQNLFR